MKSIKKDGCVKRVSDKNAEMKVKKEGWVYCAKSEYRAFLAANNNNATE